MARHRRGGKGFDPLGRSSVQRWHDARLRELEEQEEDLRAEEQQRVVVARATAHGAAMGQSVPARPAAPSADSPQGVGLSRAVRVVGALAAQSGSHPGVGWAAGVFQVCGQVVLFATSNEGLGHIPAGVRWDQAVRLVFDPSAPLADAMGWQGLCNPARIVAGHCLRLAESRNGGVQLLAVASSEPIGDRVAEFVVARGAALAERVPPSGQGQSGAGVHRAEAVLPGTLAQAASLHPWQRWNAAKALLRDAARLGEVEKNYPKLSEMVRGFEAGFGDWGWIGPVREWARFLTREAQSRRVAEERLGPVSGGLMDEDTVLPAGGVAAYAAPFYAARVCAILEILLSAHAADRTLDAEELADTAYEHYSVAQDAESTRDVIGRGARDESEQLQGGWI
ncbi:type VI secretion system baseplate subunit TssK [Segniliparus rotundus]|uniref:type VI secretion system baseplate subunit TssK n=1 Tax=Segniliparus rotundus TaxID=286802 RepID=UPI0011D10C5A|nr:type VI secretion system baseplate subunit TssK [Segniliparus rotundus]